GASFMPVRIPRRAAARRDDMTRRLDDIGPRDLPLVGGKAFNCARLRQAGFPVPDGLVVLHDSSEDEVAALPAQAWFDAMPAGTRFAVRSSGIGEDSAGHSFAGIHETQLNVERDRLVDAVLACRRSADSPAARAYREARQVADEDGRIAV